MDRGWRVGVIFGGESGEHDVSLMSASFVLRSIKEAGYEVVPIGITPDGCWLGPEASAEGLKNGSLKGIRTRELFDYQLLKGLDLVFPVLHGPMGEDGTLQGLLEMMHLPYVGSGVLGSAMGMDKEMMKRSFAARGLPQASYLVASYQQLDSGSESLKRKIREYFGYPCFVKPANMGSSVGISRVSKESELSSALREAAAHDDKLLVEEAVVGRELECSVLGGSELCVSVPGEVVPRRGFYDYQAKYGEGLTDLIIPARIREDVKIEIRNLAVEAFRTIDAYGLARVDFFLSRENELLVNEINTMPGFTRYSMYPMLWRESGLQGPQLIERLLELAMEREEHK